MPGLGPGDGPGRRPPKPKRKPRSRPQPSTEARKGAAFGSRPAAPERHPSHTYEPPPPAGDTKSDADLGRAKTHENTPKYREAVRDTYAEQDRQQRRDILNNDAPGAAGAEAERFHNERVRVQGYIDAAKEFNKSGSIDGADDLPAILKKFKDARKRRDVEDQQRLADEYNQTLESVRSRTDSIRKGLQVLKHQHDAAVGKLAAYEHASPKYGTGEAADGEKDHGLISGIGTAVRAAAGLGSGTSKDKGAVAANEQFLGNIQRVEKATNPIDFAYRSAMKPTVDATSKLLEQTNRLASASAGGAIAATEGKNVLKGAAEGFLHNDKSYTELAKKAGLHGAAAVIVGTAGDIVFDPSTYATFGLKAPATAVERTAMRKIARRYAKDAKRAFKAGDVEAQERIAKQFEEEAAAARERASKFEQTTRGIQAGVRLPGGRTIATKGRATAAVGKQVTKATAKAQASKVAKPINEVLRMFAPHVREPGVRPLEQAERVAIQRESNALRNRVAREGRQLGKFIQRATGGDVEKVRELVDAIESGTVRNLDGPLREAAERAQEFHARVSDQFKELTGKPLRLVDTVLAKSDVDDALDLARQVLDARISKAGRAAEKADHTADVAADVGGRQTARDSLDRKAGDAALDLNAAERLASRIGDEERPLTTAEERDVVSRLGDVVNRLREDVHANIARTRTNDELGAIRRGEVDNPEVKAALRAEDFYKKRARDQRAGGNRQAARTSEAKARAARAIVKAHRADVEPQYLAAVRDEGAPVLKGRAGKLEKVLDALAERVQFDPPVDYSPRQTQAAMAAAAEGKPMRATVYPTGAAGHEQARLERRRASDVREEKPDYLSDELPQLEARYGTQMGRRLGSLNLWKQAAQRFARPVTGDFPIEGDQVLYRVGHRGLERIDPDDTRAVQDALAEGALRHALGEGEEGGIFAIPDHVDKMLQERIAGGGEKSAAGALYDKWLRTFKAANTILRPGFFATTIAGNTWQQFLADLNPKDMADAWRMLAHMRSADLKAVNPGAGIRKSLLDAAAGNKVYAVDGRGMTFGDLYDEAIDAGAIRTGSRIGDPTELSLEEQASRRLKKGGAKATTEWLGEVAEDLDDMTKAIIYAKKRQEGLDPRAATQYVFSKMIDYSDLSKAERTVFKRVMPFYVYTARNLPIQIKSILARPGKLANFEKVRQMLAELAGLPRDWEGQRTEAEQERMPVAIPGIKSHGFQVFLDPRLPVADLAAPAQLGEGPGGGVRMLERYASGVAPPVKVPLELLLFKRRLDYDRPIDVPGSPPAAGTLLEHIPGATLKGKYVQPATGQKYKGAKPWVDYLLRTMGGSPGSVVASVGADVPDRSNLDPKARAAASFGGGFGVSASDPLYAVLDAIRTSAEKHYATRAKLKGQGLRDSPADIRNEDTIDALNDIKAQVQATIGFPDQAARAQGGEFERNRLRRAVQEPAEMRSERRRLEHMRRQYGG